MGEYISANTPDVCVKTVIKSEEEWAEFEDKVCRYYGFDRRTCPLIYTLEGTLIGDGPKFIEHCREEYGKSMTITKESLNQRQELNIKETEERIRAATKGDTLSQKIFKQMDKLSKRDVQNIINDAFYNEEDDMGAPVFVRRTNYLRGEHQKPLKFGRVHNIPDEMLAQNLEMERVAEEEAKKDLTWDAFLE